MNRHLRLPAFTLAELLIALAILGVIATFTIPKILDSGNNSQYNSMAKEAAGFASAAYQQLKSETSISNTTQAGHLTPYINYVKADTTATIQKAPGYAGTEVCGANGSMCYVLHNGGYFWYYGVRFDDISAATSAIMFSLDPDGPGSAESVRFFIYVNGKIRNAANVEPNTQNSSAATFNPNVNNDPSWFSWSN